MMTKSMMWRLLLFFALNSICFCRDDRHLEELFEDEILDDLKYLEDNVNEDEGQSESTWPAAQETGECNQDNKQKANYLNYEFNPKLKAKPLTDVSTEVQWEEYTFAPWKKTKMSGAIYAANKFSSKDSVGGYFGAILNPKGKGSKFMFSLWDKRENKTVPARLLSWPMNLNSCKRNCNDCGERKKDLPEGFSTGTQCKIPYPDMKVGDRFKMRLRQLSKETTIETTAFGGMPSGNKDIGEDDRPLTGGLWRVTITNIKTDEVLNVGDILFEGDGAGVSQLTAFDEMVGCNRCNDVYHRDTRFGPYINDGDGIIRTPVKMTAISRVKECTKFGIWGNEQAVSATFETGPGSTHMFDGKKKILWEPPKTK